MSGVLMPRAAAKYIAAHSKDVKICADGVKKTAELVNHHSTRLCQTKCNQTYGQKSPGTSEGRGAMGAKSEEGQQVRRGR